MNPMLVRGALGAAALFAIVSPAFAHATLAVTEATPKSAYRGVVRIGHGCAGSATTGIAVRIPEGVVAAKPMPKPGWTLAVSKASYARPYRYYSAELREGTAEIAWSGGKLDDDNYDEFIFTAYITDAVAPGATLRFPVVQTCETGESRWVEIPAEGQDSHALKRPAPGVRIVAASGEASAPATSVKAGSLTIESPWSRATPGGAKVAGGYLRIVNAGTEPDRLIGGSVEVAGRFEVHSMTMTDGVARMAPVAAEGLTIPPGGSVELKPGGYHAMMMDLSRPLKEGDVIRGTLTFEKAGKVPVAYRVRALGAQSGGGGEDHSNH